MRRGFISGRYCCCLRIISSMRMCWRGTLILPSCRLCFLLLMPIIIISMPRKLSSWITLEGRKPCLSRSSSLFRGVGNSWRTSPLCSNIILVIKLSKRINLRKRLAKLLSLSQSSRKKRSPASWLSGWTTRSTIVKIEWSKPTQIKTKAIDNVPCLQPVQRVTSLHSLQVRTSPRLRAVVLRRAQSLKETARAKVPREVLREALVRQGEQQA